MAQKATVAEIRQRFDQDVERFSNLATGQTATIDARLAMELITEAAARATPSAKRVIDVGCGAGNYSLLLRERLPQLAFSLVDLSQPMLTRAAQRLSAAGAVQVEMLQADVREADIGAESCDIILAAAVLHHLRTDAEWEAVFAKLRRALRPGGSLWIFDLIDEELPATRELMQRRYGEYLTSLKGAEYRDEVFAYIAHEDTPRPLVYQLDLLRRVGFSQACVLHKNGPFAAFGAIV